MIPRLRDPIHRSRPLPRAAGFFRAPCARPPRRCNLSRVTLPDFLHNLRGRFIVFEGPDGSGKSTQLRRLLDACLAAGVTPCEVREPGGTQVGESIRQILLHAHFEMTIRCEMLLYMASRAQLCEERIAPALARGEFVLADRFVASTYAYQGSAGGVPIADIDAVAAAATRGVRPDLVIIFDADERTAARRRSGLTHPKKKTADHTTLFDDRIERRGPDFHANVRRGYLDLAKRDPAHHAVLDASKSPDEVWEQLVRLLSERFAPAGPAV